MSVKVQGLTKIYGDQKAVDSITLEVGAGTILGFLGPNGAGKSTTMKMISGYIPPSYGTATIHGFDIITHSIDTRKLIGYLPENNPLYYDMYVKEFLNFIGECYKIPKKLLRARVSEMIEITGLQVEQHKKIGQLSKGYKQRVGLAQAIIHDPKVLILDEPTSGLDPNQLVDIRQLIKDLGKDKTVIFSTHIMQEVEAVCDRVIIINKGKIVADEGISQIKTHGQAGKVIIVKFDKKVDVSKLKELSSILNVETSNADEKELKIATNNMNLAKNEIMQFAINSETVIVSLRDDYSSIEQVFQALTK
jgi:ABC-2 type transport system ATP-binding protein